MFNSVSMTHFASTITSCMGIAPPNDADTPISQVEKLVHSTCGKPVDKVLIYNPDALGMWMYQKYTEEFTAVMERVQMLIPIATVMPSVTPVCFGTMYTGALPEIHGIKSYSKPVITTDSLFDALARAGKKVALVTVADSSMAIIFSGRNIDYFPMPYDTEATNKAMELIRDDKYDVVICYNQEFDDVMHESTPQSPVSYAAMQHHIDAFARLTDTAKESWAQYDTLVVCAPDHGTHVNAQGLGDHGDYIEEDINIIHYFGAYHKQK
ncbi:MAG: hypothetical protein RR049_00140 [Angelakisella sp.]